MGGRVFSEKNPDFHPSEGLLTFHNFWMTIVTIYNNITHKSDSMIDIRASKKNKFKNRLIQISSLGYELIFLF